jgi:hypothetical protein
MMMMMMMMMAIIGCKGIHGLMNPLLSTFDSGIRGCIQKFPD